MLSAPGIARARRSVLRDELRARNWSRAIIGQEMISVGEVTFRFIASVYYDDGDGDTDNGA